MRPPFVFHLPDESCSVGIFFGAPGHVRVSCTVLAPKPSGLPCLPSVKPIFPACFNLLRAVLTVCTDKLGPCPVCQYESPKGFFQPKEFEVCSKYMHSSVSLPVDECSVSAFRKLMASSVWFITCGLHLIRSRVRLLFRLSPFLQAGRHHP